MSLPSESVEQGYQRLGKKKNSLDSVNSDFSFGSKDTGFEGIATEDVRKSSTESNERCQSQADSGIAVGANGSVQNNEKSVDNLSKGKKVGVNVNNLYSENLNKLSADIDNLTKAALEESSFSEGDSLNTEEKLAALLNKNKLHSKSKERTDSGRSVSIELDGDSIRVVTEELEDDVLVDAKNLSVEDHNINKDESKFDSSSLSTDSEVASISSDSTNPSPSGKHYDKMINEIRDRYKGNYDDKSEETKNSSESPIITSQTSSEATTDTNLKTEGTTSSSAKNHPKTLDLSAINTDSSVNCFTANDLTTPDISVSRLSSSSGSSTTTSGPDSTPPSPYSASPPSPIWSPGFSHDSPSSSDSMSHNLQFPENALSQPKSDREKKTAKEQVCGVFSVDLGRYTVAPDKAFFDLKIVDIFLISP